MACRGIIATLAACVCALSVLLATNTARGQPTSAGSIIETQRVVIPAADDDDVSPRVERSVEAPSSQGKELPIKAEMAVADVRSKDCADGSGAETRLGLMQRTSIHGHCGTR